MKKCTKTNPTYQVWLNMVSRCLKEDNVNYSKRLIVCERWEVYENFLEDMGVRPSSLHRLTRRNGAQTYSKDTCEWAVRPTRQSEKPKTKREGFLKALGARWDKKDANLVELKIWKGMLYRCFCPKHKSYLLYKDRKPNEDWLDFGNFLRDMGYRPTDKHTLEREDNNLPYSSENCRWATMAEQAVNTSRNRVVQFKGKSLCISEWEKELGLKVGILYYRLKHWPVEVALSNDGQVIAEHKNKMKLNSAKKAKFIEHEGETLSIYQWCKKLNLPYDLVRNRVYSGWSFQRAISQKP